MDAAAGGIALPPLRVLLRMRERREADAQRALLARRDTERAAAAAEQAAAAAVTAGHAALHARETAMLREAEGRAVSAHRLVAGRLELDVLADRAAELGARRDEAAQALQDAAAAAEAARHVLVRRARDVRKWSGVVDRVVSAHRTQATRAAEAEQDDELADRWRPA